MLTLSIRMILLMVISAGFFYPRATHAQLNRQCFQVPNISACVEGRFEEFWHENGGLAVFGYPLSAQQHAASTDTGQILLMQPFERNRFELHPENARPYDVLLGRLGEDRLRQLNREWRMEPQAAGPQRDCLWFNETNHNVCNQRGSLGFQAYYQSHGLEFDGKPGVSAAESLALFGLPLTEPAMERNASGDTVLTQWFERARFEWHPNNPDQFKVLLGLLGSEIAAAQWSACQTQILPELRRHVEFGIGDVKNLLGCAAGFARNQGIAYQHFERGVMVYTPPPNAKIPVGSIWIIYTGSYPHVFRLTTDTWDATQPEGASLQPPPGLWEPKRGFGKAWREETGVRDALGWATEPEQGDSGVVQSFRSGSMIWFPNVDLVYTFVFDPNTVVYGPRYR
jgi:hypothetical protein